MVELPVWELGLTILIPMLIAFGGRGLLERRFVDSCPAIKQSLAQFRLDLAIFTIAGLVMAFLLFIAHQFPLLQSGMKLFLGILTVGVFAAMDLALSRERIVIHSALTGQAVYDPPSKLSPLTKKFTMITVTILLLMTVVMTLVLIRDVNWLSEQDFSMISLRLMGRSVLIEIVFVMGFLLLMTVNLIFSYARNLRLLFDNETQVLERVTRGDLTQKVPVTTNDELGVIAGHTNSMISALREGVRMREGLLIAQEVQQHFLPGKPPEIVGLDIAGVANFSDETGGDFYDFIDCEATECGATGLVVGDVSGHGVGAALLMAAGRALVRQSATLTDAPAESITTANRNLARDLALTGRFITLFYMVINPIAETAQWVNAGHQPPLVYNSKSDTFTELRGNDIPLGVEETWQYHNFEMPIPQRDDILLIGTDGIWEAHNTSGDMFGQTRLQTVIRDNKNGTANDIMNAIVSAVHSFQGTAPQEDDITMVVLKGN